MPSRSLALFALLFASTAWADPLPGTKPLETKDDLARTMVDGIHRYLDRATADSVKKRDAHWKPDYSSHAAYEKSIQPNRERLKKILGVVDPRLQVTALDYVGTTDRPALLAETKKYKVYAVRWPVLPGVEGEGLLLEPNEKPKACVVAIPDADQTPEMLAGLEKGIPTGFTMQEIQYARALAENGCRVVVPTLINRDDTHSGSKKLKRFTNQTHREFIYRMSYEMGRHVIGYELQRILAVVDYFALAKDHAPIGLFGYGEGGLLAFYAAAIDPRIQSTVVSGHFGPREKLHEEPIYRNVWKLLTEFGDGDVLRLVIPRSLVIEIAKFETPTPPAARKGRAGAAPGSSSAAGSLEVVREVDRVLDTLPPKEKFPRASISMLLARGMHEEKGKVTALHGPGSSRTFELFFDALKVKGSMEKLQPSPKSAAKVDAPARHKRQFDQLVGHAQNLLPEAAPSRQSVFWSKLNTKSLAALKTSQIPLRNYFHENVIGKLPEPTKKLNPRTRKILETPKWTGYEVVLDVYDDVIAFGILLVPNNIKKGEKRPVVVCQHGLEGRPMDVVDPTKKTPYYNSFGAQLADLGYIVFAPQNPYIFETHFRQIVRKANPLGLSLYSFIVRQHQQILAFLRTLGFVDPERIAFYGLSYGGKVAMRIPAILLDYCLSICSGDFNEWIWKNINLDWGGSYMFTREYDMYEFDLGNTFNYAEMAALIAPRPFMVERGHSDGVGLDEYVAFEYSKVRRFYAAMGLADRTRIEFFVGGHVIQGEGTFEFLRRHLKFEGK